MKVFINLMKLFPKLVLFYFLALKSIEPIYFKVISKYSLNLDFRSFVIIFCLGYCFNVACEILYYLFEDLFKEVICLIKYFNKKGANFEKVS